MTQTEIKDLTASDKSGKPCNHIKDYEVYERELDFESLKGSDVEYCQCNQCGHLFEIETTYQVAQRKILDPEYSKRAIGDGNHCNHLENYETFTSDYMLERFEGFTINHCQCNQCGYSFTMKISYQATMRIIRDSERDY